MTLTVVVCVNISWNTLAIRQVIRFLGSPERRKSASADLRSRKRVLNSPEFFYNHGNRASISTIIS